MKQSLCQRQGLGLFIPEIFAKALINSKHSCRCKEPADDPHAFALKRFQKQLGELDTSMVIASDCHNADNVG